MTGKKIKFNKKWIWPITAVICLLIAGILSGIADHMINALTDQGMAGRWSEKGGFAQVSCFFSADAQISEGRLQEFEHGLDSYLLEASITQESENPSARLWVDAYSSEGRITLNSDKGSLEADALGVGGDFFLFHPQKLLYGSYFSGSDLNRDYCVIDEDAAWQLFGSNDVAGMMVYISGVPHIISGVIERPSGRMIKAAGLDSTRVYVSYHTLETYGTSHGINHYEILMPDPVRKFAYKYVKEQLGSDEKETEVLENSSRFGLMNRLIRLRDFGIRSMNGKAIIYPYWENLARGYEDIIGVLTFLTALFLIYPVGFGITIFLHWWRHKGWTFKSVWLKIKDKVERYGESRLYKKHRNEEEKL